MIRTVVCEKEGCTSNTFHLLNKDQELFLTCTKCNSSYDFNYEGYGFTLLSNCSSCESNTFKVFKDTDGESIYAKCVECGNPPEKICLDEHGTQISYQEKILLEIKDITSSMEQRIMGLEAKVEALENGQNLSEVSLAYITKFLTE